MMKTSTSPFLPSDLDSSGRSFDNTELVELTKVLERGCLSVTQGQAAPAFEKEFAEMHGLSRCILCSSGTSAVHAALVATGCVEGDEVITSPLTDFGAIAPIFWQLCRPVFADVDPHTGNLSLESVEAAWGPRTRAVIVTHMFGNPMDLSLLAPLCVSRGVALIEDCAQSYLAEINGRIVGSIGDIATFSLQQTKHISTGEGGIVGGRNAELVSIAHQFINKARDYEDPTRDHHFLANNYRMSELQAAVALAQIRKLRDFIVARRASANALLERLRSIDGIYLPQQTSSAESSFWRVLLHVDAGLVSGGSAELAMRLRLLGVNSQPGYQASAPEWKMMRSRLDWRTADGVRPEGLDQLNKQLPGVAQFRQSALVLPWTERHSLDHVNYIAEAVSISTRASIK